MENNNGKAFASSIIMYICLGVFDEAAYGGTLKSNYILLCAFAVGKYRFGEALTQNHEEKKNIRKQLYTQLLIGAAAAAVIYFFLNPYKLFYTVLLFRHLLLVFRNYIQNTDIEDKTKSRVVKLAKYGGYIAVILLFCVVNALAPKWKAQETAETMGYENVEWVEACDADTVVKRFEATAPIEVDTMRERLLDYYLLYGEKYGGKFGLVYSLAENDIIREFETEDRSFLPRTFGTYFELIK